MQKKMKDFKKENAGRSMTEMLGVLAIIGVLSLGGIIGYKLAMNRYAANQIAYEINMMKTDAKVKIMQGNDTLTLGQPYDGGTIRFGDYGTTFGCSFIKDADDESVVVEEAETCQVANAYYIELQNIPEGICKPLANLIENMNDLIAFDINPKENGEIGEGGECEEGENVLNAVFSAEPGDLDVLKCDPGECSGGLHCHNHLCVECTDDTDCGKTGHCENNTCEYCESGVWNSATKQCVDCKEPSDCENNPNGKICENNECVQCTTHAECLALGKDPHCHKATGKCESCPDDSHKEGGKCVIHIPTIDPFYINLGSWVGGCKKITPNTFGPYSHSYQVWAEGTFDDWVQLYIDREPDLSDCSSPDGEIPLNTHTKRDTTIPVPASLLGELHMEESGILTIYSHSGPFAWGAWRDEEKNDGAAWLILEDE